MERAAINNNLDFDEVMNYYRMKDNARSRNKLKKVSRTGNNLQFRYFLYTIILFVLSMMIIYNYACITQGRIEIKMIENEIVELEKQKEDIIVCMETVKNSEIVEENARNYLGMNYADKSRRAFVAVEYNPSGEKSYSTEKTSYVGMVLDKAFSKLANEGI